MNNRPAWLLLAILNGSMLALLISPAVNLDYKAFYATGRTVLVDRHAIYDQGALFKNSGLWKNIDDSLPNCHLPHEALIFAQLAKLPFPISLRLWQGILVALLIPTAFMLSRIGRRDFWITLLQCAAFFPVCYSIGSGQDSVLLLLLISATLVLLTHDQPLLAGIVLSFAIFKPQVPAVIVLALLANRRYRAFAGFAIGSASIIAGSIFYFGNWIPGLMAMTHQSEQFETATKMVSLRGLIGLFMPEMILPLSFVAGLGLIVLRLRSWRKSQDIYNVFASAVLVGSLVAFHFHVQDAALFLIPLAVLARRGMEPIEIRVSAPFFFAPIPLLLMAAPATCLLAAAPIVWLRSILLLNRPGNGDEALKTSDQPARVFPAMYTPTAQTRC